MAAEPKYRLLCQELRNFYGILLVSTPSLMALFRARMDFPLKEHSFEIDLSHADIGRFYIILEGPS